MSESIFKDFAQLVDEGLIEVPNKPIIQLSISRQIIWAELSTGGSTLTNTLTT